VDGIANRRGGIVREGGSVGKRKCNDGVREWGSGGGVGKVGGGDRGGADHEGGGRRGGWEVNK